MTPAGGSSTGASQSLLAAFRAAVDPIHPLLPPGLGGKGRRSSVLVLADPAQPGLPILLIRRTRRVPSHRGQIALPGGGVDPGDTDLVATALREAREEMGILAANVEVIGTLPPMMTRSSGRPVDPVVAVLTTPFEPRPDPFEVAEWFWVPLTDLLEAPVTARAAPGFPADRPVIFIEVGERIVWGATGAIVAGLLDRIRNELVSMH